MDLLATSSLFQHFLNERRFLRNVTPSTIERYDTAFKALASIAVVRLASAPSQLRHQLAPTRRDIARLSLVLGHSQITTTQRYLHLLTGDLVEAQQRTSVLNRLRH